MSDIKLNEDLLAALRLLAHTDAEIQKAQAALVDLPAALKDKTERRDKCQQSLDLAHATVRKAQSRIDALSVESDALLGQAKKLEDRVALLKSPAEFEANKTQIANCETKNEAIQDQILELMMVMDDLGETETEARESLDKAEAVLTTQNETTSAGLAKAEKDLVSLQRNRDEQFAAIPKEAQELYALALSRRGYALSVVDEEICKGCDTRLTPQVVNQVRGRQLVTCPNCDAIVYASA